MEGPRPAAYAGAPFITGPSFQDGPDGTPVNDNDRPVAASADGDKRLLTGGTFSASPAESMWSERSC